MIKPKIILIFPLLFSVSTWVLRALADTIVFYIQKFTAIRTKKNGPKTTTSSVAMDGTPVGSGIFLGIGLKDQN